MYSVKMCSQLIWSEVQNSGKVTTGDLCGGYFSGKVSTMGIWGGRGAIFFIGTLLDVFEVIDCVRVCCERNVDWNKLEAHSKV